VSRLNAAAADGPVVAEEQLFDLFTRCAGWTRETEGAFDIATGAMVKAWGFFRREGRVPNPRDRSAAMARSGMRHVVLNPEARTVKFRVPGLEINLGAVGKGYALDRAARLLREEWGVRSAILHAGGSSVYAIGGPPGDPRGWPVRLRHPDDPTESLGTVYVRDRGLGTSAATFQFFEYKGMKLGHLLDPRTGWPASGTGSASVVAPTAAEADAISTAAFVVGAAGTERLLRLKPNLGAVLLANPERERRGVAHPSPVAHAPGSPGIATFNLAPDVYSPPGRPTRTTRIDT
jgi:thiamine biosynthesis lipoprotein